MEINILGEQPRWHQPFVHDAVDLAIREAADKGRFGAGNEDRATHD